MSDTTHISWCDSTWNPWRGCTKVSAGCANCYAEKLVTTRMRGKWGKGAPRVRAAKATFNAPLRWNKKPRVCDQCGTAYRIYLRCNCGSLTDTHRRRVFFGSLMDWLDPEVPVEMLADALDIVRRCENLDFLCVTKRPELWMNRIQGVIEFSYLSAPRRMLLYHWCYDWAHGIYTESVPKNVWIGTSVEDQKRADERIPELLKIPAKVRFLSVEPLLEPIDLVSTGALGCDCPPIEREDGWMEERCSGHCKFYQNSSDKTSRMGWVIVGGESGPHRRDCGVEAIVDLTRQCQAAGVPVFVKQDCAARPGQQGRIPDHIWRIKNFPLTRQPASP